MRVFSYQSEVVLSSLLRDGKYHADLSKCREKHSYEEDIINLNFEGMVAFIDPIREEAKDSLKEAANAGIKVIMITGDHPLTAFSISKELKLVSSYEEVATRNNS